MMYRILIFVLLCFYCFFIFLFKSNRENEEHVYDDLLAVCSSNEQISGSLQEILFQGLSQAAPLRQSRTAIEIVP